jgi:Haem-degrading
VDRDGVVCTVAFTGTNRGAQWPGSRVISAQKANTANSFSLDSSSRANGSGQSTGFALSTANLYSATQPGGNLFGLQESNPVDPEVAYQGPSSLYGTARDPMTGQKIGGVNVFGGRLALYLEGKQIVGAIGVSGDTSCADHNIA